MPFFKYPAFFVFGSKIGLVLFTDWTGCLSSQWNAVSCRLAYIRSHNATVRPLELLLAAFVGGVMSSPCLGPKTYVSEIFHASQSWNLFVELWTQCTECT